MKKEIHQVDGKFYEKCDVVMLPTEKRSLILKNIHGYPLFVSYGSKINDSRCEWNHLYILSNKEIKEGDYILWKNKRIYQVHKYTGYTKTALIVTADTAIDGTVILATSQCKKIIATTDESLYNLVNKDGWIGIHELVKKVKLPRLSNEFLKKFCEFNGIKEVLVELESCKVCKNTKKFIVAVFGEVDCYYCQELEGYEKHYKSSQPKVALDNTITIKPVQEEKLYTRDEVIEILNKYQNDTTPIYKIYNERVAEWIKENL